MVFIMDTCPVCKQALSHAPKLLPCLHSACHECLESKIINPGKFTFHLEANIPM